MEDLTNSLEHPPKIRIGVFAIQGAVEEHVNAVRLAGGDTVEIKMPHQICDIDGIILPGGESTAMAIVGEKWGLFPALKEWVSSGRPIWGTCAGMILLSDHAIKQRIGGQALIGGLDVHVCRNYFGAQVYSKSMSLDIPLEVADSAAGPDTPAQPATCDAVFIRAPAILKTGPEVRVLARITAAPCPAAREEVSRLLGTSEGAETSNESAVEGNVKKRQKTADVTEEHEVVVAVRQGNILATAFHPELTQDLRWHKYFLTMAATSAAERDKSAVES